MSDQQLINLACFLAWNEVNSGLIGKSPEQLKLQFANMVLSNADVRGSLDLGALNLVTDWLKQWRPDLAPKGGAVPPEHLTGGQL